MFFELLFELVFEILGQILFEIVLGLGWESLKHASRVERKATPVLAGQCSSRFEPGQSWRLVWLSRASCIWNFTGTHFSGDGGFSYQRRSRSVQSALPLETYEARPFCLGNMRRVDGGRADSVLRVVFRR